ncbi:glycosyltransferase [Thiomicrorhabdus sp.]|uniref:glycosyltransferase n=1 Tax=Thiomicrorhabdus sp. TaxID=2039724 RepID=UPI0029C7BCD0|nr:glycosyltransferase [Thiomicrorhabdus sp.]
MKRCLFISAHYPNKMAKYAGHKSAFKILNDYLERGYFVDIAIISNADEFDNNSLNELENVDVVFTEKLSVWSKVKNILFSRRFFPLKVNTRFSKKLLSFISSNTLDYDVIHFEFTHSASIFSALKAKISPSTKIVVSSHDILTQASLRSASNFLNYIDSVKTYQFEREIYSQIDKLIVHNAKDKALASSLFSMDEGKVEVRLPPLSDFVYSVKKQRTSDKIENALLFWGAMNRKENEDAVIKFWDLYKDLVTQKGYKLYVVGANPGRKLLDLQSDQFIVTGFLEDPSEYFIKAKIGIVPLLTGAGIKVKTLEMLEAGLPVVSTSIGAEGVSHPELYVEQVENFFKFFK